MIRLPETLAEEADGLLVIRLAEPLSKEADVVGELAGHGSPCLLPVHSLAKRPGGYFP